MPMARPIPVSVKGEDGTEFKVQLKGDEFLSWYEDTSGNVMVKGDDGIVRYSEFKKDHFEKGDALSKVSRRGRLTKRTLDSATHQDMVEYGRRRRRERGYPTAGDLRKRIRERKSRGQDTDQNILAVKTRMSKVTPLASSLKLTSPSYAPPAVDSIPFPLLIVYVKFAANGSFAAPDLTDAEIDDVFFGPKFSVASWYRTNTAGAVNVTKVDDIVRLTLPGTLQDFGTNSALFFDALEKPALNALVASGFDFTPYETTDATGTKIVDPADLCIALVVHAYDSSTGGAPGVWGHAYLGYFGWSTPNGARLMSLQTYGAYLAGASVPYSWKLHVGLAVHEGAHARFRLPDLYATDDTHQGLGYWSVMASGSWGLSRYAKLRGGRTPDCPACFDPLSLMLIDPGLINEVVTNPAAPGIYNTYFGNDNSVNVSLIETPNPDEFFAVQWRGCTLVLDTPPRPTAEMTMEMYDASLLDIWDVQGMVTSFLDPFIDYDGSTVYRSVLSCNVVYHIDMSQPDNNTVGLMLEHILEMHGGVQNLLQLKNSSGTNISDPKDPASLVSSNVVFAVSPSPDKLAGPVDKNYDPPLKMNDGTTVDLQLINFTSTIDRVGSSYTIPGLEGPSYGGCYICDRPKVYQVKTW